MIGDLIKKDWKWYRIGTDRQGKVVLIEKKHFRLYY